MSLHRYYPQLRWKPAEYEALHELDQATLSAITPIISILDIDWDFENDCYKKTLADYLIDFGLNLSTNWSPTTKVLLDVNYLDQHSTPTNHPFDICVQSARHYGKEVVPVILPSSSQNYYNAVRRNLNNGIAVSVNFQSLPNLNQCISLLNIHPSNVDVILDLGDIQQATTNLYQQVFISCTSIINQSPWRNIILSSTCYPTSQAGIPQHQVYSLPREEWQLWTQIIQNGQLPRTPSFSDYPTASSVITSVDPRFMSQYAAVRYSDHSSWIFVKGTAVRGNGWGQTQSLCQILMNSPVFFGPQFSWGDNYIFNRAHGNYTSGGSKEWRKIAHTHHLTMVAQQLNQYSVNYPALP